MIGSSSAFSVDASSAATSSGNLGDDNGNGGSSRRAPLPAGWRERIHRKTGRQLPKMTKKSTTTTNTTTNSAQSLSCYGENGQQRNEEERYEINDSDHDVAENMAVFPDASPLSSPPIVATAIAAAAAMRRHQLPPTPPAHALSSQQYRQQEQQHQQQQRAQSSTISEGDAMYNLEDSEKDATYNYFQYDDEFSHDEIEIVNYYDDINDNYVFGGSGGGGSYESEQFFPINANECGHPSMADPDENNSDDMNHDHDYREENSDKDDVTINSYDSQRTHKRGSPSRGPWRTGGGGGGDCDTIAEEGDDSTDFNYDEYSRQFYPNATSTNERGAQQQQRRRDEHNDGDGIAGDGLGWEEISSSLVVDWKNASSPQRINQSRVQLSAPDLATTAMMTAFSTTAEKTFEVGLFAWSDDDDHHRETGEGDVAVPSHSSTLVWKLRKDSASERQNMIPALQRKSNQLVESIAPGRELTQPSLLRQEGGKVTNSLSQQRPISDESFHNVTRQDPILPPKMTLVAHSDGDASDKGYDTPSGVSALARRFGLRFSKSRSRRYHSDGELSDSDWESSADEGGGKGGAERGREKTKKNPTRKHLGNLSQSPRRMRLLGQKLGQKNHLTVDADSTLALSNDRDKADPKTSPIKAEANKAGGNSDGSKIVRVIAMQRKNKGPNTQNSESNATTDMGANLIDSRKQDSNTNKLSTTHIMEDMQQPDLKFDLNNSLDTTFIRSNKSMGKSSVRRIKEPQFFHRNDTGLTQTTAIQSYKSKEISSPRRLKVSQSLSKSAKPRTLMDANQATPRNKPQHLGPATTNMTHLIDENDSKIEKSIFADVDDASSLGSFDTETLGSLVTIETSKSVRAAARSIHVRKSKQIDRLRKENDLLREELANASQLSSQVSQLYAEGLKLENERLRVSKEIIYKSTLETLFEEGSKKHPRKSRVRHAPSAQAVTEFNQLLPVAHLINGVDFDDDSITTYSAISWRTPRVFEPHQNQQNLLMKTCSRLATTTAEVASHVKTALNQENLDKSCGTPISRPLDCFSHCSSARRRTTDKSVKTSTTRKKPNSTRSKTTHQHDAAHPSPNELRYNNHEPLTRKSRTMFRHQHGNNMTRDEMSLSSFITE